MMKIALFFFLLISLGFAKDNLSELPIFNRVMLQVKEQYVQPDRINPKKMFVSALEAVQKQVPELLFKELAGDQIQVQIAGNSRLYTTKSLNSLWDLSFLLRDIFRFIEPNLPKTVDIHEIEYSAINGTLSQLDPHSVLLEPKFSKEMKLSTKGEFGGLGIVIGLREGVLTVISPLDGTPADKAGLKALDQIIKIDDNSTINLALDEAVDKLRGKPGTAVTLTIQRKGESSNRVVSVIRDIIKVESIASHLLEDKIGYVKIKAFHGNTSSDLKAAIEKFGTVRGLILDFRNNPGGLLNESVAVSDLFLDGGVVVVTQGAGASQREEEKATAGQEKTKLPIVVLVNSGSASASEIVAGALKNRNRALVIGEQTFGKGSVQMLYDFPDKSALKLTIAQYLTPGDESIQSVGITPDILLQPAYLDNKNSLLLFPQTRTREGDLDAHLDDKSRVKSRRPSFEITYVAEKLSPEEQEKRAVSSKLHEDFEIRFAKRLLAQAQGSSRQILLADAKKLVPVVVKEESKKVASDLLKMGIDWSLPATVSNHPKVELRLLAKPVAKAGSHLKIALEAKNRGTETAYQVYGISKSSTPLFADREFLFGSIPAGQKKIWELDIELPKEVLSRRDLMRVILSANHQSDIAKLDVPVLIQGLSKPVLAFSYKVTPTKTGQKSKIKLKVKNIGTGTASEPVALLKNKDDSDVFIDEGRKKIKALKPGTSGETELVFTLSETDKKPALQIQLFDAVSGEYWLEDVTIKTRGLVSKTPPQIKWQSLTVPVVSGKTFRVQAEILGRPTLKDVYMYVGEQKVLYEPIKLGKNKIMIDQMVNLKPGVNYVTIFARDGQTYSQRESITVYSEAGDPLAKNP